MAQSPRKRKAADSASAGFTREERAAMKERARELAGAADGDAAMWPTAFALKQLTDAGEDRIVALLQAATR